MGVLAAYYWLSLSGLASAAAIRWKDETSVLGYPWSLRCVGAGITCSMNGSEGVLTVNGGAGTGTITAVGDIVSGDAFSALNTGTYLIFSNATSGTVKVQTVTGALGTVTLSLPAATDTLVGKATTDTLTNKTLAAANNVLDADTAVTLAADPANCVAGSAAGGVTAAGTAESCLAVALSTTTLTVAGTANEIASSAGAQDLSANRTWTLSLPADLNLGGKSSLQIPNAAAPTVDAFGELAGDNDLWAAGRGAPVFYDGTAAVGLVGALVSDMPTNGQVPKWNTGGTITWENDNNSGGATAWDAIADPVGNGTIAFAGTQQDITSTLDAASGYIVKIADTDAVRANTMSYLELDDNDGANAKVQYLKFVGDADGTPTTDYLFTQSAATFGVPIDLNGNILSNIGNAGTDFVATTGALTLAGILTANGGIASAAQNVGGTNWSITGSTGQIQSGVAGQDGSIKIFSEDGATDHSTIFQPGLQTQDVTYTLPVDDGTSGQVLQSNGSGVLSWASKSPREIFFDASSFAPLEAADSIPPLTKTTGTNVDILSVSFDDSTDEGRQVHVKVPSDVLSGSTITFRIVWFSLTATSGNVIWDIRYQPTGAQGESFDQSLTTLSAAAAAVQGTVKQRTVTTVTDTLANLGWAANDDIYIMLYRDANNASDTMVGDAEVIGVGVEIPR